MASSFVRDALMADTVRVSITLPREVAEQYQEVARVMGVSRAGVISSLLVDFVDELHGAADLFAKAYGLQGEGTVSKRARGASVAVIESQVALLHEIIDELEGMDVKGGGE